MSDKKTNNLLMKILFLLLYVLLICTVLSSQNLVKNPGFEEYYHLPDLQYEYGDRYLYKDYFICEYWHRIPGTTPDYYHINAKNKRYKIPDIELGYHPALSDSAYVGFVPLTLTGAIEPISGEFIEKLQEGKTYEVSFNYRFLGNLSYFYLNKPEYFIADNINWRKTQKSFDWTDYHKYITPEVKANVEFTDTLNNDGKWHKLTGYYMAKGNESYLSFGIFYQSVKFYKIIKDYLGHNFILGGKDDLEKRFMKKHKKELYFIHHNPNYSPREHGIKTEITMETKKETSTSTIQERMAYYFIDNVSVVEIDSKKQLMKLVVTVIILFIHIGKYAQTTRKETVKYANGCVNSEYYFHLITGDTIYKAD